jgi:hypothetical protein
MTRFRARARWQALAAAEFDPELLRWVSNVAAAVLRADDMANDNDRRSSIAAAVGLFGRLDAQREAIRAAVRDVDFDCLLIERGNRWQEPRKLKRGERAAKRREAVAAALGLAIGDDAIDKLVRRALSPSAG